MMITFFAEDILDGANGFGPPLLRPEGFSAEGLGTICLILLTALLGDAAAAASASSGAFFDASVFTLSAG